MTLQIPNSEWELLARIALASFLGSLIGLERELRKKPAGLRTIALVAMGACAFTVVGFAGLDIAYPNNVNSRPDIARVAAQVVTGVGFLGAGTIFRGERLLGLTTAAELWASAAVGVLCGMGFYITAIGTAAIAMVIVVGGRPVEATMVKARLRLRERRAARGEPESDLLDEYERDEDD